jgi:hypothetical protein
VRLVGYFLLIIGFLWLCIWCEGSVEPLARSLGMEHFKKYPIAKSYSPEEVGNAIRSVLDEYVDNAHGVRLPAAVMLVGGILLDVARKRSEKRNPQKKESDNKFSN